MLRERSQKGWMNLKTVLYQIVQHLNSVSIVWDKSLLHQKWTVEIQMPVNYRIVCIKMEGSIWQLYAGIRNKNCGRDEPYGQYTPDMIWHPIQQKIKLENIRRNQNTLMSVESGRPLAIPSYCISACPAWGLPWSELHSNFTRMQWMRQEVRHGGKVNYIRFGGK